jgi:hypothetical protein
MKTVRTSNHERAPICAAFVKEMREVFGEVKVLWVKEGDFEMGDVPHTQNENDRSQ